MKEVFSPGYQLAIQANQVFESRHDLLLDIDRVATEAGRQAISGAIETTEQNFNDVCNKAAEALEFERKVTAVKEALASRYEEHGLSLKDFSLIEAIREVEDGRKDFTQSC